MSENEILTTAIRTYGEPAQERQAVEECSELIQAICHKHRGRKHNIAEEIADVEIMLEQLKIINCCRNEVKAIRQFKIERLYKNLQNANRCICCGEIIPEGQLTCLNCVIKKERGKKANGRCWKEDRLYLTKP